MSDSKQCKPNDCAFPAGAGQHDYSGLTIRQYFAAMAMQGLCANGFASPSDAAFRAVGMADALIAALNEPQPTDKDASDK